MANSPTPPMHRFALLDRSGKNRGTKEAATKREAELLLGLNDDRRQRGWTVVQRDSDPESTAEPKRLTVDEMVGKRVKLIGRRSSCYTKGEDTIGTVISVSCPGWLDVVWDGDISPFRVAANGKKRSNDYRWGHGGIYSLEVVEEIKPEPVYDHVKFTEDFWAIKDPTSGSGKPYGVTIGVPYPIMEDREAVSTKTYPDGVYFTIGNGAILCDKDGNHKPGQIVAKLSELKPEVKEVAGVQGFKVGDRVVRGGRAIVIPIGTMGFITKIDFGRVFVRWDPPIGGDEDYPFRELGDIVQHADTNGKCGTGQTLLEEAQDRIDGFVKCHNQLRAMLGVTGTREPLVDALKRELEGKRKERNQAIDSLGKVTDRLEYVQRENAELNLVKNDLKKTIAMKDDMIRNLTNGLLPGTTLLEIRAQEGEDGAIRTYTKHDIRDQGKKARVALGLQAAVEQFVQGCYLEP